MVLISAAAVSLTQSSILWNTSICTSLSDSSKGIHECVHWDKDYKFFELQKLLNPEHQALSCAVVEDYRYKPNQLEEELSGMEWQANSIAPKILIPEKTGKTKLTEILQRLCRGYKGTIR